MCLHPSAGILFVWCHPAKTSMSLFLYPYLKICKLSPVFIVSIIVWSVFYNLFSCCHQEFGNTALIFHSCGKVHFSWWSNTIQGTESCLHVYLRWQWIWTSHVACVLMVYLPTCVVFPYCLIHQSWFFYPMMLLWYWNALASGCWNVLKGWYSIHSSAEHSYKTCKSFKQSQLTQVETTAKIK